MAKWPNVPDVFGWLGLDRRGRWRLRGEPIANEAANRFIDRNYARDEVTGRWFFQNGPQRVFVALEYTPWVYRLDEAERLTTHTGKGVADEPWLAASLDEERNLTVVTSLGPGLIEDRDLAAFAERHLVARSGDRLNDDALEARLERAAEGTPDLGLAPMEGSGEAIPIEFIASADLPARFEFVRDPAAPS